MHSDIEKSDLNDEQIKSEFLTSNNENKPTDLNKIDRKKTPLRFQFEGEVEKIRSQIGSLEEVRLKLDLSARKICQLLMVDPSAWNRWVTGITPVPPHIYRSLQWYMMLNEKLPGVDPRFFLPKGSFFRTQGSILTSKKELKSELSDVTSETAVSEANEKLKEQLMMTQYYQTQSKNLELELKTLKIQIKTLQNLLISATILIGIMIVLGFVKIFFFT